MKRECFGHFSNILLRLLIFDQLHCATRLLLQLETLSLFLNTSELSSTSLHAFTKHLMIELHTHLHGAYEAFYRHHAYQNSDQLSPPGCSLQEPLFWLPTAGDEAANDTKDEPRYL